MTKFSLTSLPSRVYGQQVFSLTSFVVRLQGIQGLLNIYLTLGRLLFAKTIEIFLVHLPSFPWRPYKRTNFLRPKAGMTSFETILLGKEKLSILCHTQEQMKVVMENLSRKLARLYRALLFIASFINNFPSLPFFPLPHFLFKLILLVVLKNEIIRHIFEIRNKLQISGILFGSESVTVNTTH